jgi:uncharacterized protein YutE (UPF0331/DUF86 family)
LVPALSVKAPENYKDICLKPGEVGIVPTDFAEQLGRMAQFRNVLAQRYWEVDLRRVFQRLQHKAGDLERFTQYVGEYLSKQSKSSAGEVTHD